LHKHSKADDQSGFYKSKLASNGQILSIYNGEASEDAKKRFFEHGKAHYANLRKFIFETLREHLPDEGFIGGSRPGEDDFHVGAWLARIATVFGVKKTSEGLDALEDEFGEPVPRRLVTYWDAWSMRPSWQEVYREGLH
jgi:hypothetical protein